MLYKGLRFVSFIASIFVSSRVVNGQFVVTGDNQAIDCPANSQCTVQCNDDSGKYDGVTINCGDASICTVQCDAASVGISKCFKNVELNLQNTLHLQMDLENDCVDRTMTINPGTGTDLTFSTLGILGFPDNALDASSWPYTNFYVVGDMKKAFSKSSITTPANGNAYFFVDVKQGLIELSVFAGANSFVDIDCTGDKACQKTAFDATNAKHLSITADPAGTDFNGAVVTCPMASTYEGSYGESCLIDASGGGFLSYVTINTDTGVRHASGTGGELWIVPGGGTYTSVTITCQEGSAAYPLDENSPCWNGPTPAPTKTPTFQPTPSTTSPTKTPTYAPTGNPTKVPTNVPTTGAPTTKAPTPAPTRKPTSTPTDGPTAATTEDPTDSPTEDPTQSPADAPAVSPSQSPTEITESPSKSPTPAPTSPVAITCGQSLTADYNGQAVTIPVTMQYSGELTIDARSSPLAVTELSGSSPGVLDNGFGDENDAQHVITVADLSSGSYSFRLDLGTAIGQFSVSTECVPKLSCGDSVSGAYNGRAISFLVNMVDYGDVTVDARSSSLDVGELININPGVADNGFGDDNPDAHVITIHNVLPGAYSFELDLGTGFGVFGVSAQCVSKPPTEAVPTTATTSPTPRPTKTPTEVPTVLSGTRTPTATPVVVPTSSPTTPTTTPIGSSPPTPAPVLVIGPPLVTTSTSTKRPTEAPVEIDDDNIDDGDDDDDDDDDGNGNDGDDNNVDGNERLASGSSLMAMLYFAESSAQLWILGVLIVVFSATAICGCVSSLCRNRDRKQPFQSAMTMSILFDICDVLTDIFVALELNAVHEANQAFIPFLVFLVCVAVLVVSDVLSVLQLMHEKKKKWADNVDVECWFEETSNVCFLFVSAVCSGSAFTAVKMANSNLFGWETFSMQLSEAEFHAFQAKRFYAVVLLKNVSMVVIQNIFLQRFGFNIIVVVSMVFSVVSMFMTLGPCCLSAVLSRTFKVSDSNLNLSNLNLACAESEGNVDGAASKDRTKKAQSSRIVAKHAPSSASSVSSRSNVDELMHGVSMIDLGSHTQPAPFVPNAAVYVSSAPSKKNIRVEVIDGGGDGGDTDTDSDDDMSAVQGMTAGQHPNGAARQLEPQRNLMPQSAVGVSVDLSVSLEYGNHVIAQQDPSSVVPPHSTLGNMQADEFIVEGDDDDTHDSAVDSDDDVILEVNKTLQHPQGQTLGNVESDAFEIVGDDEDVP